MNKNSTISILVKPRIKIKMDAFLMLKRTVQTIRTERRLKRFYKQYGNDLSIIVLRGATGDAFIQLLFLDEFIRQKGIDKYILIGDAEGVAGLLKIFDVSNYIPLEHQIIDELERYSMLCTETYARIYFMFGWNQVRNNFNRCRVRMIDGLTFMDTYKVFCLGLVGRIHYRRPLFKVCDRGDELRWIELGAQKGKTVVVSPEANSVSMLPVETWNRIIKEIESRGFTVLVNCKKNNGYNAKSILFSYYESEGFLKYCGFFLGLRSGLCDIISTQKCKRIILYPKKQEKPDYSEHRSEMEFSSFKFMEFACLENLYEISTPLISNITDPNIAMKENEYDYELELLKANILRHIVQHC